MPEYVAQGMLGRKQYLDQYLRMPLEKRQEFAKKILYAVNVYSDKADKQEVLQKAGQIMGFDNMTEQQALQLKDLLQGLLSKPKDTLSRLLTSGE